MLAPGAAARRRDLPPTAWHRDARPAAGLGAPCRRHRAVHRAGVRVSALRCAGPPALRRPDLGATGSQAPRADAGGATSTARRPVVHVTQGTIANKDFGQLIGPRSRRSPTRTCSSSSPPAAARSTRLPPLPAERPRRRVPAVRRAAADDRRLRDQRRVRRRAVRAAPRGADRRQRRQGGQARGRRSRGVVGGGAPASPGVADRVGPSGRHQGGLARRSIPPCSRGHGRAHGAQRRFACVGRGRRCSGLPDRGPCGTGRPPGGRPGRPARHRQGAHLHERGPTPDDHARLARLPAALLLVACAPTFAQIDCWADAERPGQPISGR